MQSRMGSLYNLARKPAEGKRPRASAPRPPPRPPLTAQQSLLRNQHAGKGKGLLVVALEPLVHHLRAGPDCRLRGSLGRGCRWGGGPPAVLTTSWLPSVRELRPLTGTARALLRGLRLASPNLEPPTSPWSNTRACGYSTACRLPWPGRVSSGWTLSPSERSPLVGPSESVLGSLPLRFPCSTARAPASAGAWSMGTARAELWESAPWLHVATWIRCSMPPGPDLRFHPFAPCLYRVMSLLLPHRKASRAPGVSQPRGHASWSKSEP